MNGSGPDSLMETSLDQILVRIFGKRLTTILAAKAVSVSMIFRSWSRVVDPHFHASEVVVVTADVASLGRTGLFGTIRGRGRATGREGQERDNGQI
jgi:hypothetical protein